ncbi:MAG: PDZ domain-containing protein [Gemmatimonadota bacterium]
MTSLLRSATAAIVLVGAAILPRVLVAQGDSTRVIVRRAATPFEQELERVASELLARRQVATALASQLVAVHASLRSGAADSTRVLVSLRRLEGQAQANEMARGRLEAALAELCPKDRQPDGWMGVTFTADWDVDLHPSGQMVTRFRGYPGVEVVEPGSPAEKAGIERGDRLVSIGGVELSDGQLSIATLLRPGARLPVRVIRGVETRNLVVVIEARPADFEVPCAWVDERLTSALRAPTRSGTFRILPPAPGRRRQAAVGTTGSVTVIAPSGIARSSGTEWIAGAQLTTLNQDMALALGAERGVLIIEVAPRSMAAQSGLRGGDVVIGAGGVAVHSAQSLIEQMERARARELRLQIIRLRKTEELSFRW